MLFTLEVLQADHGDALLLHYGNKSGKTRLAIIDGGPSGIYRKSLRPRLDKIKQALTPQAALPIRLLMVSHIDDDHIRGMVDLLDELVDAKADNVAPPFALDMLWHNSFDDILGNEANELIAAVRSAAAAVAADRELPASLPVKHVESALVAASVNQGRRVRDQAGVLGLRVNPPASGRLITADRVKKTTVNLGDGLKFTVIGPMQHRAETLREEWDKALKAMRRASKPAEAQAIAAAFLDNSVFNLASLVVMAQVGRKRILLTGDARGDDILEGLQTAKLLSSGKCKVDILKVPHHGSDRNVSTGFFQTVLADHYVISADGKHGNPDAPMLQMLTLARGKDKYTIHLTNMTPTVKKVLESDRQANTRNYEVSVLPAHALSFKIDLGEPLGY